MVSVVLILSALHLHTLRMAVASRVGPLTLLNDYVPGLNAAADLLSEAPLGALNPLL